MAEQRLPEAFAARIFAQAIVENRCAELLNCLINDGSATIDAATGKLALASGDQIAALIGDE